MTVNIDALALALTGMTREVGESDESFKCRVKFRLVDPRLPYIPLTPTEGAPFDVYPVRGPREEG